MSDKRLRVIVFTQSDRFFIPTSIQKASEVCDIIEIVNNDAKSSLNNKLSDMLRWFGMFACMKMAVKSVIRVCLDIIDRIFGYSIYNGRCSVKSVSKANKINYRVVHDLNNKDYVEHVRELKPDLIISYSAPQIIKEELLGIPQYGILNVHGALLPNYRGCLPSFWYLYNEEKVGGATVHYMSKDIDDGDICVQKQVDISDCTTMFELMKRTKEAGADAMVEAIQRIACGTLEPYKNDTANGSYFTWPNVEQAREFRRKGLKLV